MKLEHDYKVVVTIERDGKPWWQKAIAYEKDTYGPFGTRHQFQELRELDGRHIWAQAVKAIMSDFTTDGETWAPTWDNTPRTGGNCAVCGRVLTELVQDDHDSDKCALCENPPRVSVMTP